MTLLLALAACMKPAPMAPSAVAAAAPAPGPAVRHERADNPFEGTLFYVKPDYVEKVQGTRQHAPPALWPALDVVARTPTAIWLERAAAIDGLRDHLEEALRQQAPDRREPMLVALVLYNLPDRDCAAGASAGELRLDEDGLRQYNAYVERIVEILSEPRYRDLRIVAILEPDSLPNLVTNMDQPACQKAAPGYRAGLAYAIDRLATLPNAYTYLDIAHSGWLGWDNMAKAAEVYREVLAQAGGAHKIEGFAANISNYTPLQETIDPYAVPEAHPALIERFYAWNRVIDEHTFVDRILAEFPEHAVIIDTGRNGWGGRVSEVPRDGRDHRGNWCNVREAGLGERPQANPRWGVHAYFWVKPPGESDGAGDPSREQAGVPFNRMCSPDTTPPTDALPNAPAAGAWFDEAMIGLVVNAYPPLVGR